MASVLILLGAPGAGKGTQAQRLVQDLGTPHVATGDLFRANLSQETPLGLAAKDYYDAGKLVPDELVIDMLFERVASADCADGYLLDGFPRTVAQAQALDARLDDSWSLRALNLAVEPECLVERATGRLLCKGCDAICHSTFSPPAKDGQCDSCGGELYRRTDDAEEVVRERLTVYEEQTKPLLAYYEAQDRLTQIPAGGDPNEVYQTLVGCLEGVR
jgi:adenylate kinase